jgi:hypothetical protein
MTLYRCAIAAIVAILASPAASPGSAPEHACPITSPNGRGQVSADAVFAHGNDALATTGGERLTFKPGGPGCVDETGRLWMKWPWWRKRSGRLIIEGRRLDGTAAPLAAFVPPNSSYGASGFIPSALIFPSPGCWEVTGRLDDASVSLVVLVEKVGAGPASRCEALFPMAFPRPKP